MTPFLLALSLALVPGRVDVPEITAAIRLALDLPDAEVEVVHHTPETALKGSLRFDRKHLSLPAVVKPESILLWRSESQAFAARFRITVLRDGVYARQKIPANTAVTALQIGLERRPVSPFAPPLESLEEALGRFARMSLVPGSPLTAASLAPPQLIRAGQGVPVEVRLKGGRLKFRATAQSGGNAGETIALKNPISHKPFRALLQPEGVAVVTLP